MKAVDQTGPATTMARCTPRTAAAPASAMRPGLPCQLLVALALVLASAGLGAAPGDRRFERESERGPAYQRQQQPDYRRDQREPAPSRFQRGSDAERGQRLSPEERHQLRRDIQDAGRAIYPQRR